MMNLRTVIMLTLTIAACDHLEDVAPEHQLPKSVATLPFGDPVKLALVDLSNGFARYDYRTLIDDGRIVEREDRAGTRNLSADLRNLLLTTSEYGVDSVGEHDVHIHRITLNEDFDPFKLIGEQLNSVIPFKLDAGAEVEFAQLLHPSQRTSPTRFTLLDLPSDAASARDLPVGTVITIPVRTGVSVDVTGQFLVNSLGFTRELSNLVKGSAFGSTSATRAGTLFARGRFVLQLARLSEDRVRLRLLSARDDQVRARVGGFGVAGAQYTFIPNAALEQVRAFKQTVDRLRDTSRQVLKIPDRVRALRENADAYIKGIYDAVPIIPEGWRIKLEQEFAGRVDTLLEKAERLTTHIERLEAYIAERVDDALDGVGNELIGAITPVTRAIQRISSRVYQLSAAIQLSDELSRKITLLADYQFDLDDEGAAIAFDRAWQGQTWLKSMGAGVLADITNGDTLVDFTLAQALADADRGADGPRVKRLAVAGRRLKERRYRVKVNGLGLSFGLDGHFEDQSVFLTDEAGRTDAFDNRAWERGWHAGSSHYARAESFAAGAFIHRNNQSLIDGGFYYRWHRQFSQRATDTGEQAFNRVLQELGPLALVYGLPHQYAGNLDGAASVDLSVVFNGDSMDALFDPEIVTEEIIWRVLLDMMQRYERPTWLPFAPAPIRPPEVRDNPIAREACEAVAQRLGGRYCYTFTDRILPALERAQAQGTTQARLDFFESFYRVPFGGAVLSTRFLARFLAELFVEVERLDGVHIAFKLDHALDESDAGSPRFIHGDEAIHELVRATDLSAILHRERTGP